MSTTIIKVSHDKNAARYIERMLPLKDGKILKKKRTFTKQIKAISEHSALLLNQKTIMFAHHAKGRYLLHTSSIIHK